MKAAVLRGPGRLALEEIALPALASDEALLRVHACGICGGDLRALRSGLRVALSCQTLGHEVAGEVVAVGSAVTNVGVGDRLAFGADLACGACWYCRQGLPNLCDEHRILGAHVPGGMSEYMRLTPDILAHGTYHRIPDGVSWAAASMAEPASSVISAQEQAGVAPGQVVGIVGAGPIGCLHMEYALALGATPVLIARNQSRLAFAEALRPEVAVVDSTRENPADRLRAMTEGRGADVMIIAAPSGEAQSEAIGLVRKRGTVVLFGGLPKAEAIVAFDANDIHYRELRVIGAFSYTPAHHAKALDLIAQSILQADRYCSLYGLEDLDRMFADAGAGAVLKAIAVPTATRPERTRP